jgi:3-hydroxy-3-methylglutaryl CoA synthase
MVGITSFGAYIPRNRVQRQSIVQANAWFNPAIKGYAKAERSMCSWDEDSLTMAVEAGRGCLSGRDKSKISAVCVASTTLPFGDRQNAGVIATALNLPEEITTLDITSSQRAGTSGLIQALAALGKSGEALFVATDARQTRAGSVQELLYGDGAAAVTLGAKGVLASLVASQSVAVDFVDHYRAQNREFDYNWEERWIRDEGYLKIVPRAVEGVLAKAKLKGEDISHFILPCVLRGVTARIAANYGLPEGSVRDNLHAVCGETGVAHPLIMLIDALEEAKPGEKLLVLGFGQGCDALVFEATEELAKYNSTQGVKATLARRHEESNYNKFATLNQLLETEKGMRAETDNQTPLTTLYRKRDMLLALVGGRCKSCGTAQFPRSQVCVNPKCNAMHTQEAYNFADLPCKVVTWSADYLTYSVDPPTHYGMVQFDEGGRFLANFTDVDVGGVDTGMDMRMMFRIKDFDHQRGFRRYFWKAAPSETQAG